MRSSPKSSLGLNPVVQVTVDLHHQNEALQRSYDVIAYIRQ